MFLNPVASHVAACARHSFVTGREIGQIQQVATARSKAGSKRSRIQHFDQDSQADCVFDGQSQFNRTRQKNRRQHRRDEMKAEDFHCTIQTHRDRFLVVVRRHPSTKEAANLAARFAVVEYVDEDSSETGQYDVSQDYFRFMFAEGVEPTNNHSEQQVRQCVIDRRITQGTRGEAGQRYHERMWSAIATCKKQDRSFFHFLVGSIAAQLNQTPPSLLNL